MRRTAIDGTMNCCLISGFKCATESCFDVIPKYSFLVSLVKIY